MRGEKQSCFWRGTSSLCISYRPGGDLRERRVPAGSYGKFRLERAKLGRRLRKTPPNTEGLFASLCAFNVFLELTFELYRLLRVIQNDTSPLIGFFFFLEDRVVIFELLNFYPALKTFEVGDLSPAQKGFVLYHEIPCTTVPANGRANAFS
jgi:hypothetical protein